MIKRFRYGNVNITAKISKSTRKNKQLMAEFELSGDKKVVHFGDPYMKEYPGTQRGDNYCARSYGILNGKGKPTRNDIMSPNFWSRKILWNCVGKRSVKS